MRPYIKEALKWARPETAMPAHHDAYLAEPPTKSAMNATKNNNMLLRAFIEFMSRSFRTISCVDSSTLRPMRCKSVHADRSGAWDPVGDAHHIHHHQT